jgi:hypothetical protein
MPQLQQYLCLQSSCSQEEEVTLVRAFLWGPFRVAKFMY